VLGLDEHFAKRQALNRSLDHGSFSG